MDFYRMTGPTEWARLPDAFSYSTLVAIRDCPRRWQLEHSRFGSLDSYPTRPSPAAVEGQIVHEVLDRLFKTLSLRGLPEAGSVEFRACMERFDLVGAVRGVVEKHNARVLRHPRGGAFRLRATAQELANRVVRLFRPQYEQARSNHHGAIRWSESGDERATVSDTSKDERDLSALLRRNGVLAERSLSHPTLPFRGALDLVCKGPKGARIVDFKTGQPSDSHEFQLKCYGLLWWRRAGEVPGALEVRYPSEVRSFTVTESDLCGVEAELDQEIEAAIAALSQTPAEARIGSVCTTCDVRPFCDEYWYDRSAAKDRPVARYDGDVEVTITGPVTDSGFAAVTAAGAQVEVVCEAGALSVVAPLGAGNRLRVLRATLRNDDQVELRPWTEVFLAA